MNLTGRVCHMRRNCFGFIESGTEKSNIFFHKHSIIRDAIGRLNLPAGTPVSFEIGSLNGRPVAINVRNIDPSVAQIDLQSYFEIGTICEWGRSQRSGLILRPNGDTISLTADDIITEGESQIRQGTAVQYRVIDDEPRWKAIDVSLFQNP